jgi:flagellar basal-body rod protein FlgB
MDQLSAILVTKALDGLALRASAISQNIANANSPSYAPVKVAFEEQLREAAMLGSEAARRFQPEFTRATPDPSSREIRLDLEMASASQTALRYAALVDVLSRQIQIARATVHGGQ